MKKYILAFDQGTSSCRSVVLDHRGKIVASAQQEFQQIFPHPGWVEHDAEEIFATQLTTARNAIARAKIKPIEIAALGITNQRETAVVWNRKTGKPIYNAIVWQDKRTIDRCNALKAKGHENLVRSKTGLVIDAYFSATKLDWILDNVAGARDAAHNGDLCFGTIDTWLIWKLTKGKSFCTDATNASRTMLFDIHKQQWSTSLLALFDLPISLLAEVKDCDADFGTCTTLGASIPICGVAGDQHAALYGQQCLQAGSAKNTYGTGCFMLMNTGDKAQQSQNGLLTTLAWRIGGKTTFALEGSVMVAGAAVQWLRDGLEIISAAEATEQMAKNAKEDEVIFVPTFSGLGAPHWNMEAKGAFFGITRDTTKDDFAKAALEAMAFQTCDVLRAMEADSGAALRQLFVDGGAAANEYLTQFQADLLGIPVFVPKVVESTVLGVAFLAAHACGLWNKEDLKNIIGKAKVFEPSTKHVMVQEKYKQWQKAVELVKKF